MTVSILELTPEERIQAGRLWDALMNATCEGSLEAARLDFVHSPLPIQRAVKAALATPSPPHSLARGIVAWELDNGNPFTRPP